MKYPDITRETRSFPYRHDPVTDTYYPLSFKVTKGGIDVNIQDQHTEVINLYLTNQTGAASFTSGLTLDDRNFTISGDQPTTGDIICLKEGSAYYQATILSVSGSGLVWDITVDSPLDFAYTTGAVVQYGSNNLNVDGSSTPVAFYVSPSGLASGQSWDITNLSMSILDQTAMDDEKFGGLSALTNGLVLRVENGITKNIYNIKSNGDFALHNEELFYADKAPAGFFGLRTHRHFAGPPNNGVTLRLNAETADTLKVIIQDDLLGLDEFHCIVQGHVVE